MRSNEVSPKKNNKTFARANPPGQYHYSFCPKDYSKISLFRNLSLLPVGLLLDNGRMQAGGGYHPGCWFWRD